MPVVTLADVPGDAAAKRLARGAHRWYFEPGAEALLRTAQPQLDWQHVGAQWTVPYGDFMAIILEFAVAPPVAAWAEAWGKDLLGADQINTALIEVCKGRMPTDWEECGLGELGERLRAAASRPLVEPSSLAVFLDAADGGSLPPHRRPLIQQACP